MHSRVKGINEIQATRADLEKKENQTALNTSERKNDEVGIRVSTLRSNEICALFRYNGSQFWQSMCFTISVDGTEGVPDRNSGQAKMLAEFAVSEDMSLFRSEGK